jgi:periplasmic divalent cation tolerance protein
LLYFRQEVSIAKTINKKQKSNLYQPEMSNYIVIYITTSSATEAKKIGRVLVEEKLAACSNIISPIRSIYSWQGKICDDKEALMILKTKKKLFKQIVARVEKLHSYDVPEIIAMPIIEGSDKYLSWLNEETK